MVVRVDCVVTEVVSVDVILGTRVVKIEVGLTVVVDKVGDDRVVALI